jgi:hypothetical protein
LSSKGFKTDYGKIIFHAEFDGTTSVDRLDLFDTGKFIYETSGGETDGDYLIKGDSIFLKSIEERNFCNLFVKKKDILEANLIRGNEIIRHSGNDLQIYNRQNNLNN